MKILNLRPVLHSLLAIGMVFFFVTSCNKDEGKDVVEPDIAQALENDEDAIAMIKLMQENSDQVLNALKDQNISIVEFKQLYELGNEEKISEALKLDKNVLVERNNQIITLAQKLTLKYPNLQDYGDDDQQYQDPFVIMGEILDSEGAITSRGKCSGWRNWRNIAKYTVCVAACAASTAGTAYFLCSLVCYFSFCT